MGCFQSRDDGVGFCGLSTSNTVPSLDTPDTAEENEKEAFKVSETFKLGKDVTSGLQKLYQKPVDKAIMKEIKIHVERNIHYYLQNPTMYIYICGQLATRCGSGFQDKQEQKLSEGIPNIEHSLGQLGIGYSCKKGAKPSANQDDFCILLDGSTVLLGVFDGHGLFGHFCSYTIQQLMPKLLLSNPNYKQNLELALKQSFEKIDQALRGIAQQEGRFSVLLSGTTATVIIHRENEIYVAHVGDSRAILGKKDKNGIVAIPLTRDHSPDLEEEKKRIELANGEVRRQDLYSPARVFGRDANYPGLAMSRAIGDEIGKYFGVIAEPEISCRKVEKSDLFITICSDGVWEFLKNEEVVQFIDSKGKEKVEKSAALLANKAFNTWLEKKNNATDDITCIIYYLHYFTENIVI